MGYEATMYLLERGVRLTGTDAWSWDAPFSYTAKRIAETGDKSLIWEGHKAGRGHRLLPSREAAQPRGSARRWLYDLVLPAQDPRRLRGLDSCRGDLRRPEGVSN